MRIGRYLSRLIKYYRQPKVYAFEFIVEVNGWTVHVDAKATGQSRYEATQNAEKQVKEDINVLLRSCKSLGYVQTFKDIAP